MKENYSRETLFFKFHQLQKVNGETLHIFMGRVRIVFTMEPLYSLPSIERLFLEDGWECVFLFFSPISLLPTFFWQREEQAISCNYRQPQVSEDLSTNPCQRTSVCVWSKKWKDSLVNIFLIFSKNKKFMKKIKMAFR